MLEKIIYTLTIVFFFISSAFSEDWRVVAYDSKGQPFSVDYSTLGEEKGYLVAVFTFKDNGNLIKRIAGHKNAYEKYAINCKNNRVALLSRIVIDRNDDAKIFKDKEINEVTFDNVPDGSVLSVAIPRLCEDYEKLIKIEWENLQSKILIDGLNSHEWDEIIKENESSIYIKKDSLEIKNEIVNFIMRIEFKSERKSPIKLMNYRNIVEITTINCEQKEYIPKITEYFNKNNLVVEREEKDIKPILMESESAVNLYTKICSAIKNEGKSESTAGESFSTGTAWQINENHLVTAYHVIEGAVQIGISTSDKDLRIAEIVATDAANDLAIIKLSEGKLSTKPLPIAFRQSKLGEKVAVIGFPLPEILGVKIQATSGEISSLSGIKDDKRFYQISAAVQSGNSGGPLINQQGEVVGVVSSKLNDLIMLKERGQLAQNVSFAVKHQYVQALIESVGLKFYKTDKKTTNIEESISKSKDGVYLVFIKSN